MRSIDKINMLLMKKGMSGAEMNTKAGFSNSVYSQWNTGKTKPGKKSLVKAAAALEVNVEDIMDDDDLGLPYGYQALNKARYDLAKLQYETAQNAENPPPVGDGLDEIRERAIKELEGLTADELEDVFESIRATKRLILKRRRPADESGARE